MRWHRSTEDYYWAGTIQTVTCYLYQGVTVVTAGYSGYGVLHGVTCCYLCYLVSGVTEVTGNSVEGNIIIHWLLPSVLAESLAGSLVQWAEDSASIRAWTVKGIRNIHWSSVPWLLPSPWNRRLGRDTTVKGIRNIHRSSVPWLLPSPWNRRLGRDTKTNKSIQIR